MMSQQNKAAVLFTIFIAIIAWLALGLQLYILVKNANTNGLTRLEATGRFFSYFTILTNLLVAVCRSFIVVKPNTDPGDFSPNLQPVRPLPYIYLSSVLFIIRYFVLSGNQQACKNG